ncbi:MAG TPA: DUF4160 domain-containing protein [Bacteroidia bacterium]|nr:DUF4160 domain-containing protein [Bacteroidia bacterium]
MENSQLEEILKDVFQTYLSYSDDFIDELLLDPFLVRKQLVERLANLDLMIYTNDHNPPHFHVKSRDGRIDAKFIIETGELLGGEIDSKNLKKVIAFCQSPKKKAIMQMIWNKRN